MVQKDHPQWWVRIRLTSRQAVLDLQNIEGVELFRSTLQIVDEKNILIEGHVSKRIIEKLRSKYTIRILGDVNKQMEDAGQYVSRTNRYLQE